MHNSLNALAFQHTLSKVWLMPVVYFLGKVIMLWSLDKKKKAENNKDFCHAVRNAHVRLHPSFHQHFKQESYECP